MKPTRILARDVDTEMLDQLHQWYWATPNLPDWPLYFYSQGGDVGVAAAIVDMVLIKKKPTLFIGVGEVGSAGVMVFLAAKKRLCTPNTRFFFHPSYVEGRMNCGELDNERRELSVRGRLFSNLWHARGCLSHSGLLTGTFYLDASEAKTYKLVQDIVKFRL